MCPTDEILLQSPVWISIPLLSGLSWVVSLAQGPEFEGWHRTLNLHVFGDTTGGDKALQTLTTILDTQLSSVAHQRDSQSPTTFMIYGSRVGLAAPILHFRHVKNSRLELVSASARLMGS